MDIKMNLSNFSDQPISTQVLLGLLKGYSRPYDKIMEMVNQGIIVQLRRGLYLTTPLVSPITPEPFLIANHLYGPSYISMDSALCHWGLIPERVFEISSVTPKISKRFMAQNAVYSFTHLPIAYYPLGIQSISLTKTQTVLIASPEKALCDKVITTAGINLRSKQQAMAFLVEDLRIDKDQLREFNLREMVKWLPVCPKKKSIHCMIDMIEMIS
jgi:predicted transcriptional regulator of viral defense system